MKNEFLTQIKNKDRREFIITSNGLLIHVKNELGESRRQVPFENITNDILKINFHPVLWIILIVTIILLFVSGLFIKLYGVEGEGQIYRWAIPFLIGGICTLIFTISNEMVIKCYNEPAIEFFKSLPSQEKLDSFISVLFKTRDTVLKKKYCFVSEFISFKDQIDKFALLHSLGIITMQEFEELKNELNALGESRSGDEININLN